MKKLTSLILAVMMILAMAVPAMAAEVEDGTATTTKYTITIDNATAGHTYEAYQIFTGDLSGEATDDADDDTNAVLSNIKWGENSTGTTGEAVADSVLTGLTVVNAKNYVNFESTPVQTVSTQTDGKYVISGLVPGYYLIKDKDGTLKDKEDDSYTEFILEVVENSTVKPKSDVPKVQKKVDDKNDSNTTENETVWQDSADHDIGDAVPFQLTAELPTNLASYDTYKLVFHDTQSAGLTFNTDTVKVYVVNGEDKTEVNTGKYVVTPNATHGETTHTFDVTIDDIKTLTDTTGASITVTSSSKIVVEYTATLNENAKLGSEGNPNVVYLEYSNNPNYEGEGTEDTGKTPDDKVIVFTYKVVANKVAKNPEYDASKDTENTGVDSDGDKEYMPLENAGFTLYKKNAAGEYVAVGKELKGEALTTFEWKGLDDGDYKLVETTTPAGYNTIADIEFTISATHDLESDDPKLTALSGGNLFTGEVSTGTLSTDVVNEAGSTLPETGGMGTTVIYVAGGLLVAAAVIIMISRRRREA